MPKNDFTRKMMYFDTFTKMPKNVGDMGKWIAAKGFKSCPKVQKIAQSGHTELGHCEEFCVWNFRLFFQFLSWQTFAPWSGSVPLIV